MTNNKINESLKINSKKRKHKHRKRRKKQVINKLIKNQPY